MPCCFEKVCCSSSTTAVSFITPFSLSLSLSLSLSQLLTHEAVYRWDESIMKGIREMSLILLELISVRLKYKPIPIYLLNLLSMV